MRLKRLAAVVLGAALLSGAAHASIVDVTFKGTVTSGGGADFGGDVTGDPFTAFYSFDTSEADSPSPGEFQNSASLGALALISSTFSVNNHTVSATGGDLPGFGFYEEPGYEVSMETYDNGCADTCYTLMTQLYNSSDPTVDGLAPVSLTGMGTGQYLLFNGSYFTDIVYLADTSVSVTVDGVSAAPEPALWALMVSAIGAIGYGLRRRRRVHGPVFAEAIA